MVYYKSPTVTSAQNIRISINGFVSEMKMDEVEFYAVEQHVVEEPTDDIIYSDVDPQNQSPTQDGFLMVDGNLTTSCNFGYNVYDHVCYFDLKYVSKIGKVRLYAKSLPSIETCSIQVFDKLLNGSWTTVVSAAAYPSSSVDQWVEFDFSDQEATGILVKLILSRGFVSATQMYEVEILPW